MTKKPLDPSRTEMDEAVFISFICWAICICTELADKLVKGMCNLTIVAAPSEWGTEGGVVQ